MPTPQDVLQRIEAERASLEELRAQVLREGETMGLRAMEKCEKQLKEIAEREAVLEPKEADLKKRSGLVSAMKADAEALKRDSDARAEKNHEQELTLIAWERRLTVSESSFKASLESEIRKLSDLRKDAERDWKARMDACGQREAQLAEDEARIKKQASDIQVSVAGASAALKVAEAEKRRAEEIRVQLQEELVRERDSIARESAALEVVGVDVEARLKAVSKREEKVSEAEKKQESVAEDQAKKEKWLRDFNIIQENKELKIKNERHIVDTLIETHKLKEEMAGV